MKKFLDKYKIQLKILLEIGISLLVFIFIFYNLLPFILNYPDGTVGTAFQHELENTDYTVQVVSIGLALFLVYGVIIFIKLNFLSNIDRQLKEINTWSRENLMAFRNKLFMVPYSAYLLNIIVPNIIIVAIHTATTGIIGLKLLKMLILLFSFITIIACFGLLLMKHELTKLLTKLPIHNSMDYKKIKIKSRITYHIIPLFMVGIIFTALLGYSRLIIEKGNVTFKLYKDRISNELEVENSNLNLTDLFKVANNIELLEGKDEVFIYAPNGKYYNKNEDEITHSDFFTKYLHELSPLNEGRVYEYYGEDSQAATATVKIDGQDYVLGVYYTISDSSIVIYFIITLAILLTLNILVLQFFANTISSDLKKISTGLSDIIEGTENTLNKRLPLTSNDEIGKLIIEFNKVQDLTKQNIEQIKSSQQTLIEKDRLASLGQLIGGIAHNLKTPIMSIAGASEGIKDLIKEYDTSIEDPEVNFNDHHEIAKEMDEWIEKIKTHTSYMSDIITTVKGQAVALSDEEVYAFSMDELIKRVDILMKHELKNALIDMHVNMDVPSNLSISGNINSLIQVINNMISNSIQAYNGKTNEIIDFNIYTENKNMLIISIKDYACGMPKDVQNKLLREMITTKGKNGTGLGLFMSNSNIKAHFSGSISFKSEEGKGTEFFIKLPL